MKKKLSVFISVGEYSGDLLAAELVGKLRELHNNIYFIGITGSELRRSKVDTIVSTEELSVMGFSEVVASLARLKELEIRVLNAVDRKKIDFAILVDNPGFHFQLAEKLKLRNIPVCQYVAPKLWAWGGGRVKRLREDFRQVFGILPFEKDFFCEQGVNYQYLGCPIRDRVEKISAQRCDFNLSESSKVVAFLPGSRIQEFELIFPRMREIQAHLKKLRPDIQCVVPVAENLDFSEIAKKFSGADFLFFKGRSLELLNIADAAVVASGTATLETALSAVPMTVIYVMNDLNYQIAEKVVKTKFISLVNLIAKKEVVKEYVQYFSSEHVAKELAELLQASEARKTMLSEFELLKTQLFTQSAAKVASALIDQFNRL